MHQESNQSTPKRPAHYRPLILLLLVCMLVGWFIVDDYGTSWDEHLNSAYGQEALKAYFATPDFRLTQSSGITGPAAFMLAEVGARLFSKLHPVWQWIEGRHYIYFLQFLLAAYGIFLLSSRLVHQRAALIATLLFLTQPLLWGHAFINPKDIPFMAWFCISVELGLQLGDTVKDTQVAQKTPGSKQLETNSFAFRVRQDLQPATPAGTLPLILIIVLSSLLLLDILVGSKLIIPNLLKLVYTAYHKESVPALHKLFLLLSQHADTTPLLNYLWKTMRAYWALRIPLAILVMLPSIVSLLNMFPRSFKGFLSDRRIQILVFAAFALGFSSATRIIGPYAGVLISLYLVISVGASVIPYLGAYWLLAGSVGFALRPSFWDQPLQSLLNSISNAGAFEWDGTMLYQGSAYHLNELPSGYSPWNLLKQLNEPLLILIVLGSLVFLWKARNHKPMLHKLLLLTLWLLFPPLLLQWSDSQAYDNFRQLLFILPPLFVFSSLGIEAILHRFRGAAWQTTFGLLIMLPGILQIVRLHPFQYIYYNALSGGVRGVYRQYELDYWCTSYREAMQYVNSVAPENAVVEIWGTPKLAQPFARDDLILVPLSNRLPSGEATLAVICARSNSDLRVYPEQTAQWKVEIGSTTLSVVKGSNSHSIKP